MSRDVNSVIRYSISFKQKVIREIEQEGLSVALVKRRYGIKGEDTIQRWMRKFGKSDLIGKIIRIETMEEKDQLKKMEAEIRKLKLALADSILAQKCLETVIDEANKAYKTDLKKSFGDAASPDSEKSTQ